MLDNSEQEKIYSVMKMVVIVMLVNLFISILVILKNLILLIQRVKPQPVAFISKHTNYFVKTVPYP